MILNEQNKPIPCNKCGCTDIIRSGMSRDKQRYQCKSCRSFFVPVSLEKPKQTLEKQRAAILMFLAGAQVKDLEEIFGVSYPTISKWIEPAHRVIEENDDLRHTRKSRRTTLTRIGSPKEIPAKPRKKWLIIELEGDHFEGESITLVRE